MGSIRSGSGYSLGGSGGGSTPPTQAQVSTVSVWKEPVRVASLENVDLGAVPTSLDGVALNDGDRIGLYGQTDKTENGLYERVSAAVWQRTVDYDAGATVEAGVTVYTQEGDSHATLTYQMITPGTITVGTTATDWEPFGAAVRSDGAPTEILASTAIGASLAAATPTDSMDVRDFSEMDLSFLVTADGDGPITDYRFRVLWSVLAAPGTYAAAPEDWQPLPVDNITAGSGVSAINEYDISVTPTNYEALASLPASIGFTSRVRGLHMMVLVWAEAGDPTNSAVTGNALRRVS